jgi:hypothetical protein
MRTITKLPLLALMAAFFLFNSAYTYAQVSVTGNVSGNWSANNVYSVDGNITIPANASLNIAPGTVIKFSGNYSLIAEGILTANGTSAAPVVFTSNASAPGSWDKIEIKNSSSTLDHCLIEFAKTGVHAANYDLTITNSEIRTLAQYGIYCPGGTSVITGNKIHYFGSGGIVAGGTASNTLISCNEIYSGGGSGVVTNSDNIVRNNAIQNIAGTPGAGISVQAAGNPRIENNYITHCSRGIRVGTAAAPAPKPLIVNNTISNQLNHGIDFDGPYASGKVINNIIWSVGGAGGYGLYQNAASGANATPDIIANNLIASIYPGYVNYSNVLVPGIRQIVTTNANGTPADVYLNIYVDPQFTGLPAFSSTSPAINAGNPTYSANIGFSIPATCQLAILSAPKEVKETGLTLKTYPNPFSETLKVAYSVPANTRVSIELFDLAGKSQGVLLNEFKPKGEYQLRYNGSTIRPGMYILKLTTTDSKTTHRMVIKN